MSYSISHLNKLGAKNLSLSPVFKRRLNDIISDSDYSKSELVKLIPISQSTLSNALAYGIIPSVKTLIKVADFFEISLNYLLGKTDDDSFEKSSLNVTFYNRFEQLCSEKGVTHYKVATDCLFDKSSISKWFRKNYIPELEIIELLCDYFNVIPDYLLGRCDYKN